MLLHCSTSITRAHHEQKVWSKFVKVSAVNFVFSHSRKFVFPKYLNTSHLRNFLQFTCFQSLDLQVSNFQ